MSVEQDIVSFSGSCGSEPKVVRLTGLENTATERMLSAIVVLRAVNSPTRITPENNAKIRPQPDREHPFARASGGSIGIRTLETVPRLHTFQACAFDHSATDPLGAVYPCHIVKCKTQKDTTIRPNAYRDLARLIG